MRKKLLLVLFPLTLIAQVTQIPGVPTNSPTFTGTVTVGNTIPDGVPTTLPKRVASLRVASEFCATPGTLDHTCINNALADFGPTPNCGTVILPQGNVSVSATVGAAATNGRRGCVLLGLGSGDGSATGTRLVWTGSANGTLMQVNCQDCEAHHLAIDGASSAGIGLEIIDGTNTLQQAGFSDIRIDNVLGTPGRSLHIGHSTNGQVSESYLEKFFINNSVTGVYQDGANTLNIQYRDFSVSVYTVAGFDIEAGSFRGLNNTVVSATTGATAAYIINTAATAADIVGGEIEHSSAVGCYSFLGSSGVAGHIINVLGTTCHASSNGVQQLNYTQNGTLNLLGAVFSGVNATAVFNPLGGSGLIGNLNSYGTVWGTTALTKSGASGAVVLNDSDVTSSYVGMQAVVNAKRAAAYDSINLQLLNAAPVTWYDGTTRWDQYPGSSALGLYKAGVLAGGWDTGTSTTTREFDARYLGLRSTAVTYNNLATAGQGLPPIYAVVESTGNTSSISTTALQCGAAMCGAGMYRISLYIVASTPGAGATLTPTITYRDGAAVQSVSGVALNASTTAPGFYQWSFRHNGSADIQYAVALANACTYIVNVALEELR